MTSLAVENAVWSRMARAVSLWAAHSWRVRALAAFLFTVSAVWPYADARTPAQETGYLSWGIDADAVSCPDAPGFLWVAHEEGRDCIRYFGNRLTQGAPVVIVQFYGDRDRVMNLPPEEIRNNTREAQDAYADRRSDRAGVPLIVMARPGTYGSTGNHARRRYPSEFLAVNAALDALRRRYGIGEFVLMGHSGGATVGAAMLTMGRRDVRCAVLSSGTYNYLARHALGRLTHRRDVGFHARVARLLAHYDPVDHVAGVVRDPKRQVFIVGDSRDTNTPFHLQVVFAWLLNARGHHAEIIEMEAGAPSFHDIKGSGVLRKASECARGMRHASWD